MLKHTLYGKRLLLHKVLFADGSEYTEVVKVNFILSLIFDYEALTDYYHIQFCSKWQS